MLSLKIVEHALVAVDLHSAYKNYHYYKSQSGCAIAKYKYFVLYIELDVRVKIDVGVLFFF